MSTTEAVAARLDDELDRLLQEEAPRTSQRRAMSSPLCLCWPDGDE